MSIINCISKKNGQHSTTSTLLKRLICFILLRSVTKITIALNIMAKYEVKPERSSAKRNPFEETMFSVLPKKSSLADIFLSISGITK